jgi:glycerophosphoryl diester phosphodiesterase
MKLPQLVAHRGYTLHYPENTLAAVDAAIEAGAHFVEIDVQLTADQVPVLYHDRTLKRLCGESGAVHDYKLAKLKTFKPMDFNRFGYKFAAERIATLEEFGQLLALRPGVTAFIELKRISLERFGPITVLNRVQRALEPVHDRCVIISFDPAALAAARAHWPAIGAVVDRWHERRQQAIRTLRPEYLFCDVDGLPKLGRLRYDGAHIVVYEVADPTLARRLARRGADFIETFAIGEMREALEG